jgi:hypothetical protein
MYAWNAPTTSASVTGLGSSSDDADALADGEASAVGLSLPPPPPAAAAITTTTTTATQPHHGMRRYHRLRAVWVPLLPELISPTFLM